MKLPETFQELQDAVEYMEANGFGDDAHCVELRELLEAAETLALQACELYVDAALKAATEQYTAPTVADAMQFMTSDWCSYGDLESMAIECFESMGETLPDFIKYHIDWKGVAQDILQDAAAYVFVDGTLCVFRG